MYNPCKTIAEIGQSKIEVVLKSPVRVPLAQVLKLRKVRITEGLNPSVIVKYPVTKQAYIIKLPTQ